MKFENVTDYEKYIVLSDRSNGKLGWTWDKFLNFKSDNELEKKYKLISLKYKNQIVGS